MLVVDTNVIAALFLEGTRTLDVRELYSRDSDWRTEPFALIEFSNVLATYIRQNLITQPKALEYLAHAEAYLMPALLSVANDEALRLASRYRVSAYDARFLAVAKMHDTVLVTEDLKLRGAAPALTISIDGALEALA